MRLRSLMGAALVISSLATVAGSALADAPGPSAIPLQIVAVKSDDAEDQAEALTAALRSAVRAGKGYSLPEGDYSLEVLTLAMKCGDVPDVGCQAKIADQIHADRYVWGTLRRVKGQKQVTVELHIWQRTGAPGATAVTYSDNLTEPGDESLKRVATEALLKLTGGPAKGTVNVRSTSATGDVLVDGQPQGTISAGQIALVLPPGDHKIEVRTAAGTETGSVTVRPGASVELVLAAPLAATANGAAEPTQPSGPPRWKRTAGFVGVGVGGAMLVGGLYSALKVSSIQNDAGYDAYRKGFHSGQDVCSEADAGHISTVPGAASPADVRDMCSSGKTFKTLQFVLFPLGAIAAGAGIYLLATDKGATQTARRTWDVVPAVGPQGGSVDVEVAF